MRKCDDCFPIRRIHLHVLSLPFIAISLPSISISLRGILFLSKVNCNYYSGLLKLYDPLLPFLLPFIAIHCHFIATALRTIAFIDLFMETVIFITVILLPWIQYYLNSIHWKCIPTIINSYLIYILVFTLPYLVINIWINWRDMPFYFESIINHCKNNLTDYTLFL